MDYEQGADPIYQAIELSKDQTATTPTEFSRMCEGACFNLYRTSRGEHYYRYKRQGFGGAYAVPCFW